MTEHRLRSALLFMLVYAASTAILGFVAVSAFEIGDPLVGWPWLWLIFASLCLPIATVGVFATWAAPPHTTKFNQAFVINSVVCAASPLFPIALGRTGLGLGSAYAAAFALLFASAAFFSGARGKREQT